MCDAQCGEFGGRGRACVVVDVPLTRLLSKLPNSTHFLDATLEESLASPTHLLLFVTGAGKLAGMRFVGQTEIGLSDLQELIAVRPSFSLAYNP